MFTQIIATILSYAADIKADADYLLALVQLPLAERKLGELEGQGKLLFAELGVARRAVEMGQMAESDIALQRIEDLLCENAGKISVSRMRRDDLRLLIERSESKFQQRTLASP